MVKRNESRATGRFPWGHKKISWPSKVKKSHAFVSPQPPTDQTPLKTQLKCSVSDTGPILESGKISPQQHNSHVASYPVSPISDLELSVEESRIPGRYVEGIQNAFGADCDLYRDVLLVDSRNATDRQIRVAYFRRGRQVLAEAQFSRALEAKLRFHAVSLAYEIFSRPDWKASYDRHGWDQADVPLAPQDFELYSPTTPSRQGGEDAEGCDIMSSNSTPKVAHASILRPGTRSRGMRKSQCTGRAIRWSNEIEELVFRCDPDEIEDKDEGPQNAQSAKLEKPAEEATGDVGRRSLKNTFINMFLKDIDASLSGLEARLDDFMLRGGRGEAADTAPASSATAGNEDSPPSSSRELETKLDLSHEGTAASNDEMMLRERREHRSLSSSNSSNMEDGSMYTTRKTPVDDSEKPVDSLLGKQQHSCGDDRSTGDIAAEQLFRSLTKPLHAVETKTEKLRQRGKHSALSSEKELKSGWSPIEQEKMKSKPRARFGDFEDVSDPFEDLALLLDSDFDGENRSSGASRSGAVSEKMGQDTTSGVSSDDFSCLSGPDSCVAADTSAGDMSIDTGFLMQTCSSCRGALLPGNINDTPPQRHKARSVDEARSHGQREGGCEDCRLESESGQTRSSTAVDQGFFSDWVTHMGRMSEDLTGITSHVSEGAYQMVNSTQQVLADAFLLPEDKVDNILQVLKKDLNDQSFPADSRSFTY